MRAALAAMLVLLPGSAWAERLLVRVLERERPTAARLESSAGLVCDGKPLEAKAASLEVVEGQVKLPAEGRSCRELSTSGDGVTVTVGGLTRRYRGALRVSVADARLAFFERAEVEDYLRGVVAGEMPEGPAEALEAQAVVSRTFALASRGRHERAGYDLCDLTHCQLYRGREDERADATEAVERTRGEVLLVGGVVLRPAFFHASCGGATSSAADVFGEEGVEGAASDVVGGGPPLCAAAPDFSWEWKVGKAELAAALGLRAEGAAFEALRRDRAGRALEVRTFGARMRGNEFLARVGRAFGYDELKSLKATAEEANGLVRFSGSGRGHGVGLCQEGARALAAKGRDYRSILKHYFPRWITTPLPRGEGKGEGPSR